MATGTRGPGSLNGERARDGEVIEAAVKIFWEKGYANASVQDVADALGMLKGSPLLLHRLQGTAAREDLRRLARELSEIAGRRDVDQ